MLNVNNAVYVLGYSLKWWKTVTRGEELLNKLFSWLCKVMVEPLKSGPDALEERTIGRTLEARTLVEWAQERRHWRDRCYVSI